MAFDCRALAIVSGRQNVPYSFQAAPCSTSSVISSCKSSTAATVFNTSSADPMTSGPIPSSGGTRIRAVMVVLKHPSADGSRKKRPKGAPPPGLIHAPAVVFSAWPHGLWPNRREKFQTICRVVRQSHHSCIQSSDDADNGSNHWSQAACDHP